MKIKYLGTAAAEGIPAIFCDCEYCRKARANGGKDFRTRSQSLINGRLLVDFNADTYCHTLKYGLDLTKIRSCVITHIHSDHYYPADFGMMRWDFGHISEDTPRFKIYGSEDILEVSDSVRKSVADAGEFVVVNPFETFTAEDMEITPLMATHGTAHPYIYIFKDGGKTLLYANDTGDFPEETWKYLEEHKPVFDLVSFDCTGGNCDDLDYDSHMCVGRNLRCRDRLKKLGLVKDGTVYVVNHFSHNGKDIIHEDMCKAVAPYGFVVAYDGMEIAF